MKKINFYLSLCLLVSFCIIFNSCKKESLMEPIVTEGNSKESIPAFPFDWENADYMPTPAGQTPILVPWASGSNQLFEPEIAFDFKKVDGWELVYNTFNTTQLTSPYFFSLYNKYRGLLRFYIYIPPGNPTPSSYFSDGLRLTGTANSSIINFGQDVSDVSSPIKTVSRIQNYKLQSTGSWYVSQFEMAYDPGIANLSYLNTNFQWNTATVNVTNVNLNGEINGTLTGTVGTGSSGGFNPGAMLNATAQGAIFAGGLSVVDDLKIKNKNIFNAIVSGLKGGLSGAVKNLASAIIGGTSTSPQLINLALGAKMNLTGSFTTGSGIASPTLVIPGSSNSQSAPGYIPAYDEILGVLNMTERPKIHFNVNAYSLPFSTNPPAPYRIYHFEHYVENAGASATSAPNNVKFNPVLTSNGTTLQILRQDIIIPVDTSYFSYNHPLITATPSASYLGMEKIGDEYYVVVDDSDRQGAHIDFEMMGFPNSPPTNPLKYDRAALRLTIRVTPPGNTSPITIVRTFKATLL